MGPNIIRWERRQISMEDNRHYLQLKITGEDAGRDVRSFLYQEMGLTTKKISSVKFDSKGILLDGKRVTVRTKVLEGQTLAVLLNDTEQKEEHLVPTKMKLDILYEDEDLLFVNKPAGLVCHPSQGHYADTLANGVRAYFEKKRERSGIHLLGRLDKDTSGIVGIAKNSVAAERMTAQRSDGTLKKEYLALVSGCPVPGEGYIDILMEEYRDELDNNKWKMRRGGRLSGKKAGTYYRVVQYYSGYSLCALTLTTGRTHQIRFHMAEIGCPLLGDAVYGNGPAQTLERAALHAENLTFIHPFTGQKIYLKAELPEDMKKWCRQEMNSVV